MKATKLIQYYSFLAILTLLLNSVMANEYSVGDEEQWSSQIDYETWVDGKNFSIGDVLVFKYLKGQHNVYEVTQGTYRSCDSSSGVLAKYDSGEDKVELSEARRYWFICNIAGHCLGGMRFGIQVEAANSREPAIAPRIEPTPSDNSCTSVFPHGQFLGAVLLLLSLLFPFGLLFNLI